MFKIGKRIRHISRIKIGNNNLKYTKELKYLGLIFDTNLSWVAHINNLKEKIDNLIYKIRNIARPTWRLKPIIVKNIYKLVIEKMILYGCQIWFKETAKIPQLQRTSLLLIKKCYRTVSNDTLTVLAGRHPAKTVKSIVSIFCILQGILVIKKEVEYIENLKRIEMDNLSINLNKINNEYHFVYNKVEIKYRNKNDERSIKEIYTDGSGLVVYRNMEEINIKGYKLNDEATVFMAELYAIDKAINK